MPPLMSGDHCEGLPERNVQPFGDRERNFRTAQVDAVHVQDLVPQLVLQRQKGGNDAGERRGRGRRH